MPAAPPRSRARVAVVFGGRSTEHSISCLSAGTVIAALGSAGHDVIPVGVTRAGSWVLAAPDQSYAIEGTRLPEVTGGIPVHFSGDARHPGLMGADGQVAVDVVFPVLHGPYGEDGTLQGLFEMANLPYVGSGVYASAAAMDKAHMKTALIGAGLPVAPYELARGGMAPPGVLDRLGAPVFVKPARGGSSIGISKVTRADQLDAAVATAAESDTKVLIEAGIVGREIECGVLAGTDGGPPEASVPAEVLLDPAYEFYDFQAKYLSDATTFAVPADLDPVITKTVQDVAVAVYCALDCAGLARVDVFVRPDGQVIVNELNTMPGFTAMSGFPRMWGASGVALPELVDRLVQDARRRTWR